MADTTPSRAYPLPGPNNLLSVDVYRLISALTAIDGDVASLMAQLSSAVTAAQTWPISQVVGLQTALDGKAPVVHNHALSSLSDVNASPLSVGFVLRWDGTKWSAVELAITDVASLDSTLSAIQSNITTLNSEVSDLQTRVTALETGGTY